MKVSLPPMPIYSTTRRRSRSRGLASTGSTRGCPQSARAGGWVRPPVATWRNWRRSAPASLSTLPMRRDAGDRRRCVTCVPLLTGALVSSRVPQAEAIYRAERFQIDTAVREATRAADAAWATLAAARGAVASRPPTTRTCRSSATVKPHPPSCRKATSRRQCCPPSTPIVTIIISSRRCAFGDTSS